MTPMAILPWAFACGALVGCLIIASLVTDFAGRYGWKSLDTLLLAALGTAVTGFTGCMVWMVFLDCAR